MDLTDEEKIVVVIVGEGRNLDMLQVQAVGFLFEKSTGIFKEYEPFEFNSGCKGAYSDMVGWIIDDMVKLGIVDIENKKYSLTIKGINEFHNIKDEIEHVTLVYDFVNFIGGIEDTEILSFMCNSFPEYFQFEEEREKIKANDKNNAASMYGKGAISLEKAVEISGIGFKRFNAMVNKNE